MFIERHQVASIVRFRVRKDVSQSVWRKFYNDLILKIRSQCVVSLTPRYYSSNGINCSFHKEDHSSSYYIRNTTSNSLRVVQKIRARFKIGRASIRIRWRKRGREREKEETRYFRTWKKKGKPGVESDLIGNGRCLPV